MTTLQIGVDTGLDLGLMKLIADELPLLCLTTLDIANSKPTNTASKAFQLARAAFRQGVRNNFHLCQLKLTFLGYDEQIEFYLELNRYGRLRLLEEQGPALVLWCYFLEKVNKEPSHMFYFLRQQPWVISSGHAVV
jgi:hypothetical protein